MPDDKPAGTETPAPTMPATATAPPRPAMPMGPTAPATVAPDSQGMRMRGMVLLSVMLNGLDKVVGLLGSKSEEGQAVMKALLSLRKITGSAPGDLSRQEVKMMGEQVGPMQAPTPQQGGAWQSMVKSKLAGMGMGGGGAAPAPVPTP